jgi:hypothetical protein
MRSLWKLTSLSSEVPKIEDEEGLAGAYRDRFTQDPAEQVHQKFNDFALKFKVCPFLYGQEQGILLCI